MQYIILNLYTPTSIEVVAEEEEPNNVMIFSSIAEAEKHLVFFKKGIIVPLVDVRDTKKEVVKLLQDCALHFGVCSVPKDDGTVLDKINNYIKEKI